MKDVRNKLSLIFISGILPLFFILALITPLWLYFSGESFFISGMLEFAEMQAESQPVAAVSSLHQLLLLIILYFPVGLFAFAIWQGMQVMRLVGKRQILNLAMARCVRTIALMMLSLGIVLPVCRFLIPLVVWWPEKYYQITVLVGDVILLLTGGLLFVTFHAMLAGIKAEEETREFI
ncbi:DUF2975 domain-containing protein [Citrobacter pasteurii]|uniref:DUF2975 domain-containing protein n=1 Tax=Citrobacter TaxID=544 RepID=UPI0016613FBF|nr:DUF2975 domain-containing protein [Citrobacter pasteurii]MBA4711168.1 DUF2975 domain-containing protein [Citrobacter pasteurii]MBD0799698.1 DUF2975 domain-containing protein [Citrobacter sp. C6_1]MBD0809518.1 DUF2975 domain-containing protein [Citrobacter sp. C6_2]